MNHRLSSAVNRHKRISDSSGRRRTRSRFCFPMRSSTAVMLQRVGTNLRCPRRPRVPALKARWIRLDRDPSSVQLLDRHGSQRVRVPRQPVDLLVDPTDVEVYVMQRSRRTVRRKRVREGEVTSRGPRELDIHLDALPRSGKQLDLLDHPVRLLGIRDADRVRPPDEAGAEADHFLDRTTDPLLGRVVEERVAMQGAYQGTDGYAGITDPSHEDPGRAGAIEFPAPDHGEGPRESIVLHQNRTDGFTAQPLSRATPEA